MRVSPQGHYLHPHLPHQQALAPGLASPTSPFSGFWESSMAVLHTLLLMWHGHCSLLLLGFLCSSVVFLSITFLPQSRWEPRPSLPFYPLITTTREPFHGWFDPRALLSPRLHDLRPVSVASHLQTSSLAIYLTGSAQPSRPWSPCLSRPITIHRAQGHSQAPSLHT